jgi:hypothetical protein
MSAILVAIATIIFAVAAGIGSADLAGKLSYKLFSASQGAEKFIISTLGGVVGLGIGLEAVQTDNFAAALYGPVFAVAWMTVVLLALIGAGRLFLALFR